jgi:peptidylprolyl isomerase
VCGVVHVPKRQPSGVRGAPKAPWHDGYRLRMPRLRIVSLVVLAGSALTLAACGNSTPSPSSSATTTTSTQPAAASGGTVAPTTAAAGAGSSTSAFAAIPAADLSPAGTTGTAPTVTVPKSAPPTKLEGADLITGTGVAAKSGDSVTVQYVLATYSSGKVIQSSWTSAPFPFTLGQGQVIAGWDQGVVGMQVGGRRELIIPPSLGYGAQSPGAGIAANDTLVFVIDVLKIG